MFIHKLTLVLNCLTYVFLTIRNSSQDFQFAFSQLLTLSLENLQFWLRS